MLSIHHVSDYVGDSMNEDYNYIVENFYDTCEVHKNCTVEIWSNSITGKTSIGWYENIEDYRKEKENENADC